MKGFLKTSCMQRVWSMKKKSSDKDYQHMPENSCFLLNWDETGPTFFQEYTLFKVSHQADRYLYPWTPWHCSRTLSKAVEHKSCMRKCCGRKKNHPEHACMHTHPPTHAHTHKHTHTLALFLLNLIIIFCGQISFGVPWPVFFLLFFFCLFLVFFNKISVVLRLFVYLFLFSFFIFLIFWTKEKLLGNPFKIYLQ